MDLVHVLEHRRDPGENADSCFHPSRTAPSDRPPIAIRLNIIAKSRQNVSQLLIHLSVLPSPDGIECARLRSLLISDKGDRPWSRLAELGWTRRSTFSSSME
jgi:hypothetical protein